MPPVHLNVLQPKGRHSLNDGLSPAGFAVRTKRLTTVYKTQGDTKQASQAVELWLNLELALHE